MEADVEYKFSPRELGVIQVALNRYYADLALLANQEFHTYDLHGASTHALNEVDVLRSRVTKALERLP